MCDFSTPFLLYWANIPTLIAGLMLGIFILWSGSKSSVNRNIFFVILFFWLGNLNSMLQWMVRDIELNLLLARLSLLEPFALLFFIYFAYAFTGERISLKKRLLLFLPFLPLLILLPTNHNSYMLEKETCTVGLGFIWWYMYILVIIYPSFVIRKLINYSKKMNDEGIRKQAKLITGAVFSLVVWSILLLISSSVLVGNGYAWGDELLLFIPVGLIIFTSLIVYTITNHKFLNLKLLSAQALTVVIWLTVGSQFFFVNDFRAQILIAITLVLSVIFGIMLVNSVKLEVERKEQLQEMTDKLAAANDQLRKLDNAKSEFISIASHQLRTPLTATKGFLSLMLEGSYGKLTIKHKDVLNKIYTSNERLINLVEDLLNLSRIESGRMEYKFEKVDMADVCQEVYDTFMIKAREKKLKLCYETPESASCIAMTDRNKIREVVSNVVDNAIKYTMKGNVTINLESKDDMVEVRVADTGIGIPESELPYLFQKFSRGKDISRLNTGGTGLGLHVGKRMMEALHGDIRAESRGEGTGSTFVVEVPVNA